MTVNIISDIHATINEKTHKVYYNEPRKNINKLSKTIVVLRDSLIRYKSNFDNGKANVSNDFSKLLNDEIDTYVSIITVYNDIIDWLNEFLKSIETKFANVDKREKLFAIIRTLTRIKEFLKKHHIDWKHKKSVLDFNKMFDMIFKYLYDFDPTKLQPADYLIIAGDLGVEPIYDLVLEDIKKKTNGKFKKILHIAGNHDHWWFRIDGISEIKPDHTNFDHDYCEFVDGDYAFIGCTLWTPITDREVWQVGRYMNDYNYTPGNFSPYVSRHQYEIQSAWLRDKLAKYADKKVVVFTHHQPFDELTLKDYKHNGNGWDGIDVNAAYVVQDHSLDDINEQYHNIVLWACGHTHQNFDGMLHGIHVVRNPIGYRDLNGYLPPENVSDTWYNKIIEI